jgi:hypothetical protein
VCGGGGAVVLWGSSLHRTLLSPERANTASRQWAPHLNGVQFFRFPTSWRNFCYFFFVIFISISFFPFFGKKSGRRRNVFLFCFSRPNQAGLLSCVSHTLPDSTWHTHTIRCAFAAAAALRLFNNRFAVVNHVCCASSTPELSREAFTAILKSSEIRRKKKTFFFCFKIIFKKLLNPIPDHP